MTPDGIIYRVSPPGQPPIYSDAAWNQIWIDTDHHRPHLNALPIDTQPLAQMRSAQRAGTYYENPTNKSKMVYFAFGLEGLIQDMRRLPSPALTLCGAMPIATKCCIMP
jgi:hypothetical protein